MALLLQRILRYLITGDMDINFRLLWDIVCDDAVHSLSA